MKHMDILLSLEPVTSQQKLRELRQLFDLVEAQVRGLKSLGVESTSYGSLLTSVLLQKLPHELRLIMSREVEEGDWNLDELFKQLERERESCIGYESGLQVAGTGASRWNYNFVPVPQ